MKKILTFAALGVLALAGVAFAQSIGVPTVSVIHPTTDLMQVVPNGQPQAQAQYATPAAIVTQEQYQKINLSTTNTSPAYTVSFANTQADILITASGTITYTYINFAPNPSDGARECFYSNQTVTTAYPTANTGQTVNSSNTLTAMTANARYCFLYSASNLVWDRDGQ
jgi:hypothetical protein